MAHSLLGFGSIVLDPRDGEEGSTEEEIELWIFHGGRGRTNLCRNGGEFLRSAVPSANASALFINNEEVSAVNMKKPPGSHPHKSHSLNREMWSSFVMIFFQGIVSDSYLVVQDSTISDVVTHSLAH